MVIVGIKELNKSIGSWVLSEDAKEPEDGKAVRRTSGLMGRGQEQIATNEWRSQMSSESIVEGWYPAA